MRLTAIKLSGFKSFVDPTTFRAPSNLTGIVGPNGCGKSNIIDAVRWVMGEGSARVLRGELMSDVIFAGSSTRKPVGSATVELMFDNSDGQVGGELAGYNEISVKRQVSRDGISTYTLNGTRCRRKDIRDLFLGTGLDTRSGYSVIEQGMISQVVDARPEEIRAYLEEAAGISRYKERRRETENRIAHTRDNLDRLSDLREEVANHLARLQRQARAAERYKKLKQQQRELESRLLALQWREQMERARAGKQTLSGRETALAEKVAAQRAAEAAMEKLHQAQADASEAFNVVQGELYEVGSDIARLEQSIQHHRELQAQSRKEYEETAAALKDLEKHMLLDRAQVDELTTRMARLEPELAEAQNREEEADQELADAEAAVQDWQERMERHHQDFGAMSRKADGLRAGLEVLDERMAGAADRLEALAGEHDSVETEPMLKEIEDLERQHGDAVAEEKSEQERLDAVRATLSGVSKELREGIEREHALQRERLAAEGRLEALRALQEAGRDSKAAQDWLEHRDLGGSEPLVRQLKAEPGWEAAVETVLGDWLEARVAGALPEHARHLGGLGEADVSILGAATGTVRPRSGTLAEKVQAPDAVISMLNHVRVVEELGEALEFLDLEGGEQSAVTRNGEWIGPGWARVARGPSARAGMLAREQEIQSLQAALESLEHDWKERRAGNESLRERVPDLEEDVESLQARVNELHRSSTQLESRLAGARARVDDLMRRAARIDEESERLKARQKEDEGKVREARRELDTILEAMASAEEARAELDRQRGTLLERRDSARVDAAEARKRRHDLALETGACRASLDSLNQSLARMDSQVNQLQQRYLALSEAQAGTRDPEKDSRPEMETLLQRRVEVEARLGEARKRLQGLEEDYRERDAERQQAVQAAEEMRGELERARLQQQELELEARNLERQARQLGDDVSEVAGALPDDADSNQWQADIERMAVRISRLEPVNLAAIQEYEEELKRKEYLDAQNQDLTDALETLESAIAKIDRRTRTRFKDTFEAVNKGLQELFPRLFGGGHAYLEMTGEDLLTTGVSIMARPPGKRVASIHLLSGGEKALTAVSFVFAIFRLNPAPFCLLDEVDAPLDDANVARFSDLVREMSESVQFIIVTHNKITMETVHQLSGVTMQEPGVSRLVQVDIDEAARLAES